MKMRGSILVTLFATLSIFMVSAQTPSNSIVIDPASFRPIQTDALTGIAIDPIGLDSSKRPCTRLKMRINRMTREEISELSFRLRGGVIDLRKCQVAHEGNGLIIEMTAYKNTVFYLQHPRFGMSNEVTISTEGNKEYYIEASLNQLYPMIIASNAADADVYIDDTFVGRTNAENMLTVEEVLPGQHQLKLIYGNDTKECTIGVNRKSVYFRLNVNTADDMYMSGSSLYDQKQYTEALPLIREAAESGHIKAQYLLGFCYEAGRGVAQSDTEAAKWYHKAAEQGNCSAQCRLGDCYYEGRGVVQNDTEAVKWYRKAAEQGNCSAQCRLGDCYRTGKGVKQDCTQAGEWYLKAAEQGSPEAFANLENLGKLPQHLLEKFPEIAMELAIAPEEPIVPPKKVTDR